jgi:hypothetical protein
MLFQQKNRASSDIYTYLSCGYEVPGECFLIKYPFLNCRSICCVRDCSKFSEMRLIYEREGTLDKWALLNEAFADGLLLLCPVFELLFADVY